MSEKLKNKEMEELKKLNEEQELLLVEKFSTLNGAKFININGYVASSGEISNHTINVNVDVLKAKERDLETLKNFPHSELEKIAEKYECDLETAEKGLNELITSAEKNLSDDKTNQSIAQTNAYTSLGKGLRVHNESQDVYISGFANNKQVIVEGEPKKPVKSAAKTLVKNAIKRNLVMSDFRNFKLGQADSLKISGDIILLNS